MRFPFALTVKIARHIIKHKLLGTQKFALVLQLEPLHTCNLTCTGCGRIREYSTSLKDMMTLEDCLESARECDAPMVSICGGDPIAALRATLVANAYLEAELKRVLAAQSRSTEFFYDERNRADDISVAAK
jgi:MoaA/NifB/PqqE/SkfB family radical SAM enzyme